MRLIDALRLIGDHPAQISVQPGLDLPEAEAQFDQDQSPFQVLTTTGGLFGRNGVLPRRMLDLIAGPESDGVRRLRHLLEVAHSNLFALLRQGLRSTRFNARELEEFVLARAGIHPSLAARAGLTRSDLIRLCPLLRVRPLSAGAISDVLSHYLGFPCHLQELPSRDEPRRERELPRVSKLRVCLEPDTDAAFRRLVDLSQKEGLYRVLTLCRLLAGDHLFLSAVIKCPPDSQVWWTPQTPIGATPSLGRLGRTAWLGPSRGAERPDKVIIPARVCLQVISEHESQAVAGSDS